MKTSQRIILTILVVLTLGLLAGIIYTHSWADYRTRLHALWLASNQSSTLVDTHPLDTAEQLAPYAVTRLEKNYSQVALQLADHSVDMAFAIALQDATENPAPLTPETRALVAKIQQMETTVAADQDRVDQLKKQLASARGSAKDKVQSQLDLAQAQQTLDQDALDDAHDDLIRAGGDKHATIQRLLDQHEASDAHKDTGAAAATTAAAEAAESTQSASISAQFKAWSSMQAKKKLLLQARQDSQDRIATLTAQYSELKTRLDQEKKEKRIIHRPSPLTTAAAAKSHAARTTSGAPAKKPSAQPAAAPQQSTVAPEQTSAPQPEVTLDLLTHLSGDQKTLSALDKRIEDEQQLSSNYMSWVTFVNTRQEAFLHGMMKSFFWILLIALCVFLANSWVQSFFAEVSVERRELHTARAIVLLCIQVVGIILILLVIFGVPQNFATVVALAGAGLTVALKDFIMAFIGWFILIGKDGIRPGDWVEINGVAGEVLEVGLLHTVLLETGSWTDAAHPTGRKVSFNNSFAIEGHFFNFSATGQWLWDQAEALVPPNSDPAKIADAIQKIATQETSANAQIAEQEWHRAAPSSVRKPFSAAPSVVIRPTAEGINISVRYLTRVNEREQIRTRLYRAIVDLLRGAEVPAVVAGSPAVKT
jgi:small-conductance mechanosensitive channel